MKEGDMMVLWNKLEDDQKIGYVVRVVGFPSNGSVIVQSSFMGMTQTYEVLKEDIETRLSEIKK